MKTQSQELYAAADELSDTAERLEDRTSTAAIVTVFAIVTAIAAGVGAGFAASIAYYAGFGTAIGGASVGLIAKIRANNMTDRSIIMRESAENASHMERLVMRQTQPTP